MFGRRTMKFEAAERILVRERAGTRDTYAPLSRLSLRERDPLGRLHERFLGEIDTDAFRGDVELSSNALKQIAGLAGVPPLFLARLPASVGLGMLRSCLTLAQETKHDPLLLFRLRDRGKGGPVLRAVLPSGFVRYDDLQVLDDVRAFAKRQEFKVAEITANDATFSLRLVLGEPMNLGSAKHPDPAFAGLNILTSECGEIPLQVRRSVYRVVCANGATAMVDAQERLHRKRLGLTRERFREVFLEGLDEAMATVPAAVRRMADARSDYIHEPAEEVKRVFRDYGLGNPRGLAGRLVLHEIAKTSGLLGVSRFDFIQAFTRVAQGLDTDGRTKFEDAMGRWVMGEAEKN